MTTDSKLELVLAGPILRHVSASHFGCWLVTSEAVRCRVLLKPEQTDEVDFPLDEHMVSYQAAANLWIHQIQLPLSTPLPEQGWVDYQLLLQPQGQQNWLGLADWGHDNLCYSARRSLGFYLAPKVTKLLHGSCRKPHHDSIDGLVEADALLAAKPVQEWPQLLLLSGDQIYCDDVAAPMLRAIHQAISELGFTGEDLPQCAVSSSDALHHQQPNYFNRSELLPLTHSGQAVADKIFKGVKKPIFTSDNAENHLISLAEVVTMYLMVWSPSLWQANSTALPPELSQQLSADELSLYQQQQVVIDRFAAGLANVRRLMAHVPTAMIFDDHDVTDDWNLSARWEQIAYGNPLSKRIIGNALLGYYLCQGQGNQLTLLANDQQQRVQKALDDVGQEAHQQVLETLFAKSDWGYSWPTTPTLVVLDTRTQRWRSERSFDKPSGLMDYEAIVALQSQLEQLPAAIVVSPAPVFGVKLIEAIQHVFTFFGKPLMVDAESWMAHPGAAKALLDMFKHQHTPERFVILSGDVHYSFMFAVRLRHQQQSSDIWQITSSGIKNEFPDSLLRILDRLNRWIYSPKSPLNWFTKRRDMAIVPYLPESREKGRRLLNAAGIGLVELDEQGAPINVYQLCEGGQLVGFQPRK
ncbi:alkaline phosphatase D family protein [Neiella marina]|uniref:Alkaline phosphatase D family protein n=1 Tax=Neiella holothuriorum TaxID=2870530 RepID=A0ABS7EII4_9GAMM|nr:alkaline phosphatase D family protein [Neiella holothuriorum]MBW8192167.1 alkaline phosphatase D family protein [Neiella holothuriorum]